MRRLRGHALAGAALVAAVSSASAQVSEPRLTTDGTALILLDEVREPPTKRQPLVSLEFPPEIGSRHIRVAGRGVVPPAAVELRCGPKSWKVALSEVRQMREQTHAFFAVEKQVAEAILTEPSCRLVLVGVQIPIPGDLLRQVWVIPRPPEPPAASPPPAPR